MTEQTQNALLDQYKALEKARDMERSKLMCSQSTLDECEDKMAAIETQFQKAGLDITMFL